MGAKDPAGFSAALLAYPGSETPADRALGREVASELRLPPDRLVSVPRDVLLAVERRVQQLKDEAAVDEMTGVLRRAAGLDQLRREVRRAHRFDDHKLVVAFCDLDDLKVVNDTWGHAAGDAVLRETAAALRRRLRAYDLVIRWGGDEFVCSLPGAGLEAAQRALEDIRTELHARTACTFSAGFGELCANEDAEALVARADADFYERRLRERWGPSRQNRQGSSAHSPAYATPIRGVRTTAPGAGRKPSSTT
jgi:diguanylate cyclase (GGDEF)-like protein